MNKSTNRAVLVTYIPPVIIDIITLMTRPPSYQMASAQRPKIIARTVASPTPEASPC